MAGHAFFYLRDPAWTASLPEAERAHLRGGVGRGPRAPRRPQGPRARLRASRCATTPTRAASATWCAPTCSRSSTGSTRPAATPDALEQARIDQEAYAAWLVANTIERRADLVAVDVAVDADGPGVVVSGAPGGGVSTLLAAYAAERRARHPDELVISYFVDAQRGEASERELLAYLCRALGDDDAGGRPARPRPDAARAGLRDAARSCSSIDGLHLIEVAGGGVAWLPSPPPAGLRAGGRHASRRDGRAGWSSAASAGSTCSSSTPRSAGSRPRPSCTAYSKGLDRPLMERDRGPPSSAPTRGSCAPCSTSCASTATTSRCRSCSTSLLAPADLAGLVEVVIDRYERDYELDWPGLVGAVLGPLAASRTGLTEAELLDLLGDGARRPLSQLQLAAGSLIGDFGGRLRLSFDQVQAAAQRRYLTDAPDRAPPRSPRCSPPIRARRARSRSCPGSCSPPATPSSSARCSSTRRSSRRRTTRDANLLARLWARLEETSSFRAATAYAPFAATPLARATSIVTPIVAQFGGAAGGARAAPRGRRRAPRATTRRATCRPRSPTSPRPSTASAT